MEWVHTLLVQFLYGSNVARDKGAVESVIDLFKTVVVRYAGHRQSVYDVTFATLARAHRFNHERLQEALGYLPLAKYGRQFALSHDTCRGLNTQTTEFR